MKKRKDVRLMLARRASAVGARKDAFYKVFPFDNLRFGQTPSFILSSSIISGVASTVDRPIRI